MATKDTKLATPTTTKTTSRMTDSSTPRAAPRRTEQQVLAQVQVLRRVQPAQVDPTRQAPTATRLSGRAITTWFLRKCLSVEKTQTISTRRHKWMSSRPSSIINSKHPITTTIQPEHQLSSKTTSPKASLPLTCSRCHRNSCTLAEAINTISTTILVKLMDQLPLTALLPGQVIIPEVIRINSRRTVASKVLSVTRTMAHLLVTKLTNALGCKARRASTRWMTGSTRYSTKSLSRRSLSTSSIATSRSFPIIPLGTTSTKDATRRRPCPISKPSA